MSLFRAQEPGSASATNPPAASGAFIVRGSATFDDVPPLSNGGLNYAASTRRPVRGATVQLLAANGAVLATTRTAADGTYAVGMAAAQPVSVRVRAELKDLNHDISVRDNTQQGALYAMDSATFTPTSTETTVTMNAPSGWGGTSYTSTRVAGPFAILDTVYLAKEKVVNARPDLALPRLTINWSVNNRPASGQLANGEIGTSFFTVDNGGLGQLFILGAANTDTDEYDRPVVAHEFGHFLQFAISRDDSVGGPHTGSDKLDHRVAFSEGFGNAWAGMVLGSPIYHDSRGNAQAGGFSYSVATVPSASFRGWFNESTVEYLLWQAHEDGTVGFGPLLSSLLNLRYTPAFTTIHSFQDALRRALPGVSSFLTRGASVGVNGSDRYGAGETNNGGLPASLPVYQTHTAPLGASQRYCVSAPFGVSNKLGNYSYVKVSASGARTFFVTRDVNTTTATDPDVTLIASDGARGSSTASIDNAEAFTVSLPAGDHVLAIEDFKLAANRTSCFNLRID